MCEPDIFFVKLVTVACFVTALKQPVKQTGCGSRAGWRDTIRFDAGGAAAGIKMQADKQIRVSGFGLRNAVVKADIFIGGAGLQNFETGGFELLSNPFGEVEC